MKRLGLPANPVNRCRTDRGHPAGHKRNFDSVMYTTAESGYAVMQLVAQVT